MTRDYYISRNGTAFDILEENTPLYFYFQYMTGVIGLLSPETDGAFIHERAIKILQFEQELAKLMMSPEEQRDYNANYEEISIEELVEMTSFENWDWIRFFAAFFGEKEVGENERIVIFARDYLSNLGAVISRTPIETLKDYAAWLSVKPLISTLSEDFQQLRYKLILAVNGVDFSCQERWRVCIDFVQESLPLVVGRLYVENFFNRNIKTQVENFAESIRFEFIDTLANQKWMDLETKSRAKDKANRMKDKYGFPPYLLNNTKIVSEYDGLVLKENDDFWGYTWTINEWAIQNHNKKLRKPVDKELWSMSVQETNAYYSPTENAMVFPAGILQPPLYHIDYPSYFNYGAIGMIIGHEITHGFDDQGRHMDADGNRKNWWGNSTSENFAENAECMIDQYDKQTFMGMNLSGKLTLGENIADNGGVKIAYNAWKRQAKEEKRLPGMEKFSSEQMFFVATAHAWCSESLQKAAQNQMRMDAHPPNKIRVNQAFRNFRPFSEIWECPAGSPMNPKDRCQIW